jgi:hypothetical protein
VTENSGDVSKLRVFCAVPKKKGLGFTVTGLVFSRITCTHSLSFSITTFSASLTNFTALLPESHDCSCHVSRRRLAPPALRLKKHSDLSADGFLLSVDLWHQQGLAKTTCPPKTENLWNESCYTWAYWRNSTCRSTRKMVLVMIWQFDKMEHLRIFTLRIERDLV